MGAESGPGAFEHVDLAAETLPAVTRRQLMGGISIASLTAVAASYASPEAAAASGWVWPVADPIQVNLGFYDTNPDFNYSPDGVHRALDIVRLTERNAQVCSIGAGRVSRTVPNGSVSGLGNHVYIDHGGGYHSMYAHLLSYSVSEGTNVRAGQVIGIMGGTGSPYTYGAHLHLETFQGGTVRWTYANPSGNRIDPHILLGGASAPPAVLSDDVDNMIIIYATAVSSDGLVQAGRTYANSLSGPLVLLSALEVGALEYWKAKGIPYRRADWHGDDVRSVIAVRGLVNHASSSGRSDYATVLY